MLKGAGLLPFRFFEASWNAVRNWPSDLERRQAGKKQKKLTITGSCFNRGTAPGFSSRQAKLIKGTVQAMSIQSKTILFLIISGIIDVVIPIPILAVVLIYVAVSKPPWFADVVREIYKSGQTPTDP